MEINYIDRMLSLYKVLGDGEFPEIAEAREVVEDSIMNDDVSELFIIVKREGGNGIYYSYNNFLYKVDDIFERLGIKITKDELVDVVDMLMTDFLVKKNIVYSTIYFN